MHLIRIHDISNVSSRHPLNSSHMSVSLIGTLGGLSKGTCQTMKSTTLTQFSIMLDRCCHKMRDYWEANLMLEGLDVRVCSFSLSSVPAPWIHCKRYLRQPRNQHFVLDRWPSPDLGAHMGANKQLQLVLLLPHALAFVVFSGIMMEATSFSMTASTSRDSASGLNELSIRKRVLVIGSGAVGCLYGGRLKESGHDVTFMMRRELEAVRQKGLKVKSPDGDMVFPPEEVKVVGSAAEYEAMSNLAADWVIFTLKSTSFNEIPKLLGENVVGPNTRLLLVMNGLGLEADLVRLCGVKEERVFGGMAFVCANRGPPGSGEVAHLAYGKLMIGHVKDDPQELAEVRQLWQKAKVPVETADDLLKARYEKLCWNIPFNGLGVLLGGVDTQKIVSTPELRTLASRAMHDVITLANADLQKRKDRAATIPREHMHDLMFELTDRMGPYMSSTVLDLLSHKQLETEYMFNRPLARSTELDVSVPYLDFVCRGVEGLRRIRGL